MKVCTAPNAIQTGLRWWMVRTGEVQVATCGLLAHRQAARVVRVGAAVSRQEAGDAEGFEDGGVVELEAPHVPAAPIARAERLVVHELRRVQHAAAHLHLWTVRLSDSWYSLTDLWKGCCRTGARRLGEWSMLECLRDTA